MKNLNGNLLCAIDVETTGTEPLIHSILDIAVIPLDDMCRPSKKYPIFTTQMKPREGGEVDFEALKVQYKEGAWNRSDPGDQHSHKVSIEQQFLTQCILGGVEQSSAAELFVDWFHSLKLGLKKRIVPLAHNWYFDSQFIKQWLGSRTMQYVFDPRARDTLPVSNFENDVADFRSEPFPYPKNRLSELATRHHIEPMVKHRALDDAYITAQVYAKMIQHSMISYRLVTIDDLVYKCVTCGSTAISKMVNGRPYCCDHMDPDVQILKKGE